MTCKKGSRRLVRVWVQSFLLLIALFLTSACKQKTSVKQEVGMVPQVVAEPILAASTPSTSSATPVARPSGPIQFTDITAQAGIHFKHNSGAFGKKYLPETMGSGVCFIDDDNDGWQD